ncbi:MAG TPA: hypothetical protein VFD58_31190 [Blastocatellia bacterium]|nr:hypothetical protein [Blastocatellia bacterium]
MTEFLIERSVHREHFDLTIGELRKEMDSRFNEQVITLNFIQADIETVKTDLQKLARRTREDDAAFTKELIKLRERVAVLEKQLKKLKAQPAA